MVALSTDRFEVVARAELGRQPLDVAAMSDGRVIGRGWQTGDLLEGVLEPA